MDAELENNDSVTEVIQVVASCLGYEETRHLQETAVRAFVAESNNFLSIRTGGGKSLYYAVLPCVFDMLRGNDTPQSLVIVVSPLVALMKDQVRVLTRRNMSAVHHSGSGDEKFAAICDGRFQLVFMSSERNWEVRDMLLSPVFQEYLVAAIILLQG